MNRLGLMALFLCVLLSSAWGARLPSVDDEYNSIHSSLLHGQDSPAPAGSPVFDHMGPAGWDWTLEDSVSMSGNGSTAYRGPVHLVAHFSVRPGKRARP
jgi:hypothetical protein